VLMGGRKFRKATGTETGEHPMFRLHLWSIKPNAPADLPCGDPGKVRRDVGLSDSAKQALRWLYSDQANGLSAAEARASILAGFGESVDKELRSFLQPNAGAVPRRNDVGTSPLLAVSGSGDK